MMNKEQVLKVKINIYNKDYNIMINGENFFDQPVKNNKVTYKNIRKIATGQGDDYTAGFFFFFFF